MHRPVDWSAWSSFFERRAERAVPDPHSDDCYDGWPPSLARSLAIFQLGESGGGTIVEEARESEIEEIDGHYADAIRLFVREENRHAEMLATCVGLLGGSLIRRNWTAWLFVGVRRLIGLRFKVMILLAAEVVGLCYYHLLASRLPHSRVRDVLSHLVDDERAHLEFHCAFLHTQTRSPWRRAVFVVTWRITMVASAFAVLLDHYPAIRDLGIGPGVIFRRWMLYSRIAERFVVAGARPLDRVAVTG